MDITDYLDEFFDVDDHEALLDSAVYSEEQLRRDKIKLRKQRNQIEQEMNQYASEYKEFLQKGAQTNEIERERYAKKAQIAKKKYKLKKRQYQKNSVLLGTVVSIEGARELQDMHDGDTTEIESIIRERDVDVESVQEHMMNQIVEFDLDMETMHEAQDSLDVDIKTTEMGAEDSEEVELMEELASGSVDADAAIGDIDDLTPSGNDLVGAPGPDGDSEDLQSDPLESDIEADLLDEDDFVDDSVSIESNQTTDGRLETDIQVDGVTVRIRESDSKVAVTWPTQTTIDRVLDILMEDLGATGATEFEASWMSPSGAVERTSGTVDDLADAEWFPEECRFAALDGGAYELRWEDDPGEPETYAVTVTSGGDLASTPVSDLLKETLRDELSRHSLELAMGETEYVLEERVDTA